MRTIKLVLVMLFSIAIVPCGGVKDSLTKAASTQADTPTGVTATAGNGQVTISWNAVSGADSYNLYMATQTGVTKSNALAGAMTHANVTSPYVHTGLTNGTQYYYVVTALNSAGESTESTEVSATPQNSGTWNSKASMSTARAFLSAGVVNGVLYAVGGSTGIPNNNPTVYATNEAYDPAANTWTSKTSMTTARYGAATGVVGGKLYVMGGWNSSGALASVEAYDYTLNTWTTMASMPSARGWLAAGVVGTKIYAVGGFNVNDYATVEAYDTTTNTWATVASMPTARNGLAVGVVNGVLYAVGGVISSAGGSTATVEAYDSGANAWSTQVPMPTARYSLAAGAVNGSLYVVGGTTTAVEVYDPVTNSWTTKAPMSAGRQAPAADVVNGTLYVVGGLNAPTSVSPLATSEAYAPFDSTYTGSWSGGQSNGANLTGTLTLTIANGVVTGDASPISGSTRTITGTMSATGAITASIPMGSNGCDVSLVGQVSTNSSGGLTATGTYTLIASPTCNANSGTWIAT